MIFQCQSADADACKSRLRGLVLVRTIELLLTPVEHEEGRRRSHWRRVHGCVLRGLTEEHPKNTLGVLSKACLDLVVMLEQMRYDAWSCSCMHFSIRCDMMHGPRTRDKLPSQKGFEHLQTQQLCIALECLRRPLPFLKDTVH